ncbi:MAG TPA: glycosyltransferase family 2 protein [Bacillota bacterium]|nr:glycosyltransferase family 2 protein [Bacillota bacterium]
MSSNHSINVSVIIPVYNQAEALRITLKHFGNQSYPATDYEVIVVDDGSTDGLPERIHEPDWPQLPCRINYLRQENAGRAVARNTGIAAAQGEWLIFCDADRVPRHNFIAFHAEWVMRCPRVAVIGCPWDYFGKMDLLQMPPDTPWENIQKYSKKPLYYLKVSRLFGPDGATNSRIAWASFLVGNSSVKKTDLEKAGGFDPDFKAWGFEHFELALRLQDSGVSFYHLPQAGNFHLPHPRGTGYYQTMIESSLEIVKAKHPNYPCELLGDFLMGKISLQDFEVGFGGTLSAQLAEEKPIFNLIK